jgi:hypothetical protein
MLRHEERRLIALFHAATDLLNSLARSLNEIQVEIHAIGANTQKQIHEDRITPPPVTKIEAKFPPSITAYYESKNSRASRFDGKFWTPVLINFFTLAAVVWYASTAEKQLVKMKEANSDARTALSISQRAYLSVDSIEEFSPIVRINISNFGHVPATIVSASFDYLRVSWPQNIGLQHETYTSNIEAGKSVIYPGPASQSVVMLTLPTPATTDGQLIASGRQIVAINGSVRNWLLRQNRYALGSY